MNKKVFKQNVGDFLIGIAGCSALGLFGAFIVTFDGSGWISFIAFGTILLFILIPAVLVMFVFVIIKAVQDKAKQCTILLLCCGVLPISFFGSIVLLDEFRKLL